MDTYIFRKALPCEVFITEYSIKGVLEDIEFLQQVISTTFGIEWMYVLYLFSYINITRHVTKATFCAMALYHKEQLSTCSTIPHIPGCFCPWTFFQNIGFNMVPSDPFMSYLATQLGYSAGEFRALQLIVLATFGVVD